MNTDRSEEEVKQVVLHVSEIEKVVVKQGESLQEVDSMVAMQETTRVEEMIQSSVVAQGKRLLRQRSNLQVLRQLKALQNEKC